MAGFEVCRSHRLSTGSAVAGAGRQDPRERSERLPVPNYILENFPVYETGVNALVGASGTGKSFVALHIAAELACSLPDGHSVVYLAFEGLQGYSARWEAWKFHSRADTNNLIFYGDPVNFMIDAELTAFLDQIRADHPALLIVDTAARSMTGFDENATRDMGVFVAAVERVKRELSCTVLLVHHTNKQGGMRGNSSLYNACDSVLFLKRVGAQIELHNEWESGGKNKHRPEEPTRYLKLLPKSVQVGDQLFESAVLVESDVIIRETEFTLKPSDLKILKAINGFENGLPPLAISEATGISKSTIYRNLQPLVENGYLSQSQHNTYAITDRGREAFGKT
ncbi:MAG: AAA family ATPase [Chloroflexi bacterium]|nr:AAA family ATPase [Chloroflexota bacterium]